MDLFAAVRKLFGDKSADVIPGVNYSALNDSLDQEYLTTPAMLTNPYVEQVEKDIYSDATTATGGTTPQAPQAPAAPSRADTLRSTGNSTLDELLQLYDEVISQINTAVGTETTRINGSYDDKVKGQGLVMDQGMRDTDASNAARNLGESSYMSADRQKVKDAADANINTINEARRSDLGELGKLQQTSVADYQGRKNNLGVTRTRLQNATDEGDIEATVNTITEAKNGIPGEKAKWQSQGEYMDKANSLGTYDTTALDATIQGVVDNASASQESKNSTIKDIIDGTGMTKEKKDEYKNKYIQVI